MWMNRILIVEDEQTISRLIEVSLTRAGYECTVANDGVTAADLIQDNDFDLALLDIMLPGLDGYDLLEYLRPMGTPVIFLTAKSSVKDRVRGLSLGADDYLVKPFEVEELIARVEAVLRRTGRGGQTLTAFDVTLDLTERRVMRGGEPVDLTPREFALLEQLMRNRGRRSTGTCCMSGCGAARWPIPAPWTCTSSGCAKNWTGTTRSRRSIVWDTG